MIFVYGMCLFGILGGASLLLSWVIEATKKRRMGKENYEHYYDSTRDTPEEVYFNIFIIMEVVAVIIICLGILRTLFAYPEQINKFEELRKVKAIEKIYTEKSDNLTTEFKLYLAKQYPDHEKDIFDKMQPKGISQYLVIYPQIRSSETISLLVEKINKLQDDIYEQQIKRAGVMKDIRFRKINPWNINPFIPAIPEDLKEGE